MLEPISYDDIKYRIIKWSETEGFNLNNEDILIFKKDNLEKVIMLEKSGEHELFMLGVKYNKDETDAIIFSFSMDSKIEYDESSTMLLVNETIAINLNKFFENK